MAPQYDPTSDTFQVPTIRYQQERGFLFVPDWEQIERTHLPDWMGNALETTGEYGYLRDLIAVTETT